MKLKEEFLFVGVKQESNDDFAKERLFTTAKKALKTSDYFFCQYITAI